MDAADSQEMRLNDVSDDERWAKAKAFLTGCAGFTGCSAPRVLNLVNPVHPVVFQESLRDKAIVNENLVRHVGESARSPKGARLETTLPAYGFLASTLALSASA